jgi:hypothetical protein
MAINSPYRSSADLVSEALSNLGVLSAGNPIDVEDFNWVNEKLDAIFRQLAGLEIAYVPDPDNIPGAWFAPLADIVAGECASKFGLVGQELMDKKNLGLGGAGQVPIGAGTAAMALKIMTRGRPTYEPLRITNF